MMDTEGATGPTGRPVAPPGGTAVKIGTGVVGAAAVTGA
jgi:hypothetical protein